MLACRFCEKWQHAICYGVFPGHGEESIRGHVCVFCAADENVDGTCFDPTLLQFSAPALKQKALFRRASFAASEKEVLVRLLSLLLLLLLVYPTTLLARPFSRSRCALEREEFFSAVAKFCKLPFLAFIPKKSVFKNDIASASKYLIALYSNSAKRSNFTVYLIA